MMALWVALLLLVPPQTPAPLTVFVGWGWGPAQNGFVEVTPKPAADAVATMQKELKKFKGLRLVNDPTAAAVRLHLTALEPYSQRNGGAMAMPMGNGVIVVPTGSSWAVARATVRAGDYTGELTATKDRYASCAKDLAKQLVAWMNTNRAALDRQK